jgi:outer membrane receptor for ferrienterochelin and colicins
MKYFTSILFISLFCFQAVSQIKVVIKDEHTDKAIEGAHLKLYTSSDTLYTITDYTGNGRLAAKEGTLWISHVSYNAGVQKVKAGEEIIQIYMAPANDNLDEVVVTGQARPIMASEAVRHIRVIDAQRIEQQAAVNLKDLLTNDLNFRITEDAILGTQINLQGLSGSKVKILIDGVPVIGRLDGNLDLSQINLNDIERVEVVEGPMAVQYGTDAVAGTINLITKRKAVATAKGGANAYYETVGRYNFDGFISFPMGKWQGTMGLGRNFFDGYSANSELRDLQWNPKEQYFMNAGLQRRFDKVLIRYRGEFFDEQISNLGEVGSIGAITLPIDTGAWIYPRAKDEYYNTRRINNSLYADYYPSSDKKVKVFVAYNHYRRVKESWAKNLTTGDERLFEGLDAQDTTVFATLSSRMFYQHDWLPKKLSYQLGYDFNYESNIGERIAGGEKYLIDAALFATADYSPFKKLKLQPGLRYAYNSQFKTPLIASMALRYQISKSLIGRASYGQAFRAPTLKELHFLFVDENHNILGNENLKPETSHNYQIGVSYAKGFKSWSFETDANGFFNDIHNEIRLISVVSPDSLNPRGLYQNRNVARTQTTGATFSVKARIKQLEAEAGFSLIGVKNELSFDSKAATAGLDHFNYYPQMRLNVNYLFSKMNLRPALFINHTGERSDLLIDTEDNMVTTTFEAYTMADFTLQKGFFKNKLRWTVGVKNIFDRTSLAASNTVTGGGAHPNGGSSIPLSYGRTYFTRLQLSL